MGWKRWRQRIREGAALVRAIDRQSHSIVEAEKEAQHRVASGLSTTPDQMRAFLRLLAPVFELARKLANWIPG